MSGGREVTLFGGSDSFGAPPPLAEEDRMAIRDFIPAGAERTPAEAARIARHSRNALHVIPDFIPPEGAKPRKRLSREEKLEAAKRRALVNTTPEEDLAHAKARLRKMVNAQEVIAFIDELPEYRKRIFVKAEAEDQGRVTVLRRFSRYVPREE